MSVVSIDADTGEVLEGEVIREFTEDEARHFVERINHSVAVAGDLIVEAYERRIWKALGYSTWDAFAEAEIGMPDMAPAARAVLAVGLRQAGMSIRAIAAATGSSRSTIQRDVEQVSQSGTPAVTGVDGKTYPATQPERNATQQEGAGDDGSPCESDDAESVDGADSHDVGRTQPESAPAPPDPGEADDREPPGDAHAVSTSPGSPITDETSAVLDAIDPEGAAALELARFRSTLAKEIHRVHAGLLTLDPERVALASDGQDDLRTGLRLLRDGLDRWFSSIDEARPKPFTVIRGGAQ